MMGGRRRRLARRRCPPPSASASRPGGREQTDYIFRYWSALGWTILTFGIYGLYVFYQLIRRMRDHNARRLELLDAATAVAWEQAGRQGLQQEMAPSFERAAGHLAVLRQMTGDFRDPVIWLLLVIVAGIAQIVAFVLLDQDLIKHSQAEAGAGRELSVIYSRLGQQVAGQLRRPDPGHDLRLRHLHALVVLQPDGRAEQALHQQLGSGRPPRERRRCGQLSHPGTPTPRPRGLPAGRTAGIAGDARQADRSRGDAKTRRLPPSQRAD